MTAEKRKNSLHGNFFGCYLIVWKGSAFNQNNSVFLPGTK